MSEAGGGLFGGIYGAGPVAAQLTDTAWLQAMLDVEAALAQAGAELGRIPGAAAEAIAGACRAEGFDLAALGAEAARHATPVVGLVAALRARVGTPDAEHVHAGATSQDVIDSALMLLAQRAARALLLDTDRAADAAIELATAHADTPMVGRTLLQDALPVAFGLVAAGWAQGLSGAAGALRAVLGEGLPVQLGGPVGAGSPELARAVASRLGLSTPALPWATDRVLPARLAAALGVLAGALGKVARDVTLLAAPAVGELREGGRATDGASSAMAHKRNPVAAVSILACAKRTPGLVATMLSAMEQEHQRAAGAWQSEWGTLTELLTLTGSAAAWGAEMIGHLEIDTGRMRANLDALARASVTAAERPEEELGAAAELIARARAQRGAGR